MIEKFSQTIAPEKQGRKIAHPETPLVDEIARRLERVLMIRSVATVVTFTLMMWWVLSR